MVSKRSSIHGKYIYVMIIFPKFFNHFYIYFRIAMTTHCASRYQKVLKQIAPRICIVEEAAEVNKNINQYIKNDYFLRYLNLI